MSALLRQISEESAVVAAAARRSLVSIRSLEGGTGTGIVLHRDGLVVTNAHVVGSKGITVSLPGGPAVPARVLAVDREYDLAAIVTGSGELPALEMGNSRELRPGQWVVAVGHPLGIEGAATAGNIIGTGPRLYGHHGEGRDWIAVSLQLRPGNSGGPLLDAGGRIVGINTMMTGPTVGMAVPVHSIKHFLHTYLGAGSGALEAAG